MKITEIRINKVTKDNLRGFASITFDESLCVTGVRILEGKNGLFVSMPNSKGNDGKYYDIVFPLSKDGRKSLNDAVLEAFNKEDSTKAFN